jgi:putative sugar O-methyltransferase
MKRSACQNSRTKPVRIIKFIGCLTLSCLMSYGCQKKEVKNPPRCIYDHVVFAEASLNAVKDDTQFAQFKKNPFFNLLWENLSREEGEMWLQVIEDRYPFLIEKFDLFRASDRVGSPRVFSFGPAGEFSPSTLRLAAVAADLQSKIGSWAGMQVVQIGAGYGGLCKIMSDISAFASYTLVDLPEQLALAKKYLEGFGLKNVVYLSPGQLPKKASYDLVVSDMNFSEFNRSYQELLFDRVLLHSHSGYLLGHVVPKHYGITPLSLDEIRERFEKKGKFSKWEMQDPTIEKENYLICFK